MGTSPIAPEWKGNPKNGIMIVLSENLSAENDLMQEIVYGINRAGLIKILEEYSESWYITNYIKCCPPESHNYRKSNIDKCNPWLEEEKNRLNPKLVIGFGKKAESAIKCDHIFQSLNNLLASKKKITEFKKVLKEFYDDTKQD